MKKLPWLLSTYDLKERSYAGQVSLASPIGRGLLGAQKGEEVVIELPAGERRYEVLDLTTLPQQLEASEG